MRSFQLTLLSFLFLIFPIESHAAINLCERFPSGTPVKCSDSSGATSLTGLSDVGSADTTIGHILVADGSKFQSTNIPMSVRTDSNNVGIGMTAPTDKLYVQMVDSGGETINATPAAIDAFTVLLLHADGTNGSTTFTDSSSSAHSMTAHGSAQISTSTKKFGSGSASFDGVNSFLTTPSNSDFQFGTGDFTIEAWEYWNNTTQYNTIFQVWVDANNEVRLYVDPLNTDQAIVFSVVVGGVTKCFTFSNSGPTLTGTQYHIEVDRSGSNFYIFLNGVSLSQTTSTAIDSNDISLSGGTIYIGSKADDGTATHYFNGFDDEIRVSKGIARHTSNFSPPVAPYGGGTVTHLKFQENGTTQWSLGHDGADNDKFKIGTTDINTNTRLTIDSSGNVGIGYTSPSGLLTVAGNVGIGNSAPAGDLDVVSTATANNASSVVANSLTVGNIGSFTSSSASTATRVLLQVTNSNSGAVGATGLKVTQNSSAPAIVATGLIQSTASGYKFPDSTIQTTAAISGATSLTGLSDVGSATETAGNILVSDGTKFQSVAVSGTVTMTSAGVTSFGNGKAGGQTLIGGSSASDNLTLKSTSNATKGFVAVGSTAQFNFDETNTRLSIGASDNTLGLNGTPFGEKLSVSVEGATDLAETAVHRHTDTAVFAPNLIMARSRGTEASETIVQNGDALGYFGFWGHNGTDFSKAAQIASFVDATPGAADMPGRLSFWTTPDGSTTLAERMRITNAGNVGIGLTNPTQMLDVNDTINAVSYFKGGAALSLTGLSDVATSTKTNGNLLIADGTNFRSVAMSSDATIVSSGALTIGNNKVTTAKLATTGVTAGTYSSSAITVGVDGRLTNAASGSLTGLTDVSSATKTAGNILVADGTNFKSVAVSGMATITSAGATAFGNGVAGGQTLIGGANSSDNLTLKSTSGSVQGSISIAPETVTYAETPHKVVDIEPTVTLNAGSVDYHGFWYAPTVTNNTGITIMSAFTGAGNWEQTTAPLLINWYLFRANPTIFSQTAAVAPFPTIPYYSAPTLEARNVAAGTSTGLQSFYDGGVLLTSGASGSMTVTNLDSYSSFPSIKATNASGTITVTTRRGLHIYDPAYTATGTVTLTNNIGVDIDSMVVGTSGNRTATNVYGVRSQLTSGTNRYFLYGSGSAASYLNGNVGIGYSAPGGTFVVNGNVGIGKSTASQALDVVGEAAISGISGDGTGKTVCIKSDGNLGTCSTTVNSSGVCTCG